MWKESAVSLSSCVQRRRVLQLIGLISEVEKKKKTAKYPFISCSFFSQIHSQSLASSIFHMSINGPRPGTNELTDPQFIPLCRFLCVQNVCERQMCVLSLCMSTTACFFFFFFKSFHAVQVLICGCLVNCNGKEHRVYLHINADAIFNADSVP